VPARDLNPEACYVFVATTDHVGIEEYDVATPLALSRG
jgi:hypothetical protein